MLAADKGRVKTVNRSLKSRNVIFDREYFSISYAECLNLYIAN